MPMMCSPRLLLFLGSTNRKASHSWAVSEISWGQAGDNEYSNPMKSILLTRNGHPKLSFNGADRSDVLKLSRELGMTARMIRICQPSAPSSTEELLRQ